MRKILIAGGLTAAAVAAVIGAASTNAISGVSAQTVGYASANITGAAVTSVHYDVDQTADDQLDSVTIVFTTNLVGKTIQIGFGDGTTNAALSNCASSAATGVVATTAGVVQTDGAGDTAPTKVVCALSSQTVTGAANFRLLVTG